MNCLNASKSPLMLPPHLVLLFLFAFRMTFPFIWENVAPIKENMTQKVCSSGMEMVKISSGMFPAVKQVKKALRASLHLLRQLKYRHMLPPMRGTFTSDFASHGIRVALIKSAFPVMFFRKNSIVMQGCPALKFLFTYFKGTESMPWVKGLVCILRLKHLNPNTSAAMQQK